jgi:transcriptional regulator GlxA family with amidase domain
MTTKPAETEVWRVFKQYADNPLVQMKMDELSGRLGVSRRTLFNVCKKTTGLGPAAYIRLNRMTLAHDMLGRAAGSSHSTVTDIAMFCGFHHLSRFAGSYNQAYGQKPSDALRDKRPKPAS